jgi:hypothetical protein
MIVSLLVRPAVEINGSVTPGFSQAFLEPNRSFTCEGNLWRLRIVYGKLVTKQIIHSCKSRLQLKEGIAVIQ